MMLTKEQDRELAGKLNHAMIASSIGGVCAGYCIANGWIVAALVSYGLGIAFAGFDWFADKPKR